MQFIRIFFEFFNGSCLIRLGNVSKEAAQLFRNPEIFCCTDLQITCTSEVFDLNILLDWLYFNGNNNDGKKRFLHIGFNNGIHEGQQVHSALGFMESIAEVYYFYKFEIQLF